jgi:hypothetical protein
MATPFKWTMVLRGLGLMMFFSMCASASMARDGSIEVVYDRPSKNSQTEEEHQRSFSVEALFKNSFLSSSLASGTDALNRSLESLMHSIFYSLMDNEFRFPTGKHTAIALELTRELYSTRQGPFVVVDRIAAGPRYSHELYNVQDIPVVASGDAGLDALDIYLRTDAERISENESLPYWRVLTNNWFGLVPFLSAILPPSFDPNELYDPLKRLEAPFQLPMSVEGFYRMPLNGIRSYGITGGIGLVADLQSIPGGGWKKTFERLQDVKFNLPLGIFKRGEYRVNVLRKSEDVAWLSVANVDRQGISARAFVGNTVYLLANAIPFYKGIPGVFAPIDIQGEVAWTDRTDRVYEFDMKSPTAREAYVAAVRGDLTLADVASKKVAPVAPATGVAFHFRKQIRQQSESVLNNRNLVVVRDVKNQERSQAEVAITDNDGTYHLLEAREDHASQHWDILVGPEDVSVKMDAKIKVRRIEEPGRPDGPGYRFEFHESPSPMRVSLFLDIEDRYTTVDDLQGYLGRLTLFSGLDMPGLPHIPRKDQAEQMQRRRMVYFDHPGQAPLRPNPSPLQVGRFAGTSAIVLDSASLDRVAARSVDDQWRALAKAFGKPPETWAVAAKRKGLDWDLEWGKAALAYLLRIGNYRSPSFDAIYEGSKAVKALAHLREARSPIEKRIALYELFDSDHPDRLARALAELAGIERLPRRIKLHAQPKGDAPQDVKRDFETYDGRVFRSSIPFPKDERFTKVDQELEEFQPQTLRPALREIAITGVKLSNPEQPDGGRALTLKIRCDELNAKRDARVYLKLVQNGRLQLTNLSLAERVLSVRPSGGVLEIVLSGPRSPFAGKVYDRLIAFGGPLSLTLAVAPDGQQWTERKVLKFQYDSGELRPE